MQWRERDARMSSASREWFLVQLPLFCPSLSVGVSCLSRLPSLYLHQFRPCGQLLFKGTTQSPLI